jgi:hypothetical protein
MKNIYFLSRRFYGAAQSQEITDALRYSQDNLNGTARFRAMGCIWRSWRSSLNVNPAGSAILTIMKSLLP